MVRIVGRKKEEPAPDVPHGLGRALALVCGQIVENYDGSGIMHWGQLRFNVSVEGMPIHGPLDDPGCDQGLLPQSDEECLSALLSKWCLAIKPLVDRGMSAQ